ncbi:hypothetical protein G7046_g853 [Stylonectria norvegica]|nr:hypothetical protein G7046_g853 [Stylonectria norvegica]
MGSKTQRRAMAIDDSTISMKGLRNVIVLGAPDSLPHSKEGQVSPSTWETTLPKAPSLGLSSGAPPACTCRTPVSKEDIAPLESDETLLAIYMDRLSTRFPFVIIPSGSTPAELQRQRPFLMKVIRMVATVRNLSSMRWQSQSVLRYIAEATLVRSERSLDLLQGILVFLGFYHYHCMTHAQFGNLVHLAASLTEDMNLGASSSSQKSHIPLMHAQGSISRTNEEKRTLLGVWYIRSNAALVVRQIGHTSYTKDLDQCLGELQVTAEYETDQLAVQLVRFQHLTNRIIQFHGRDQVMDDLPGSLKASVTAYTEAFQRDLEGLRMAVPPNLKSDYLILCHYNSASLQLLEPLLAGAHLPDVVSSSFDSLSLSGLSKVNIFSHFTAAVKTWFEDWLTVPVCAYFYMPQPTSVQLIHACWALTRWVRVVGPTAVKIPTTDTTASKKESSVPRQPLPAFSGIASCPNLSSLQSSVETSVQTLDVVKAQITAQLQLRFDVFGILDAMVVRFEAASEEMKAAQGGMWYNDTWDLAADHVKVKKMKIEKWCAISASVASERRHRVANTSHDDEMRGGIEDTLGGGSLDEFDWLLSEENMENRQWQNDLLDGLLLDADIEAFLDIPES